MDKKRLEEYYTLLEGSGKMLKTLLSEAQLTLGKMETFFVLIQKEISKEEKL